MSVRVCFVAGLVACGSNTPTPPVDATAMWESAPALPEPVANNAVAALEDADGCTLFTATGIDATRLGAGVHARAWALAPGADAWTALPDVPGPPRIAASAVTLRGRVYVLGGYSVAANGDETTHDLVVSWHPASGWTTEAPMPTPIDDAVVVAWRDRWIVVVSGWSNTAPVATTQIFDVDSGAWTTATGFPGTPVFGHAGALVGDDLLVVDGVAARLGGFALVRQTWAARLDPARPGELAWRDLGDHPGPARYRAAAGGVGQLIVVHGGTDTPYNFDGLRYDNNQPAVPDATTIAFDPSAQAFVDAAFVKPLATMDHRGLVGCTGFAATIGGMVAGPATTADVSTVQL